tara:strand:+ start:16174 stop:16425 length:252 start_codon:yes stop_codon:yes gene_type:complete
MKLVFVTGEDFAAAKFEDHFKGVAVESIIDEGDREIEGDDYFYEITVVEVGDVSKEFLTFVRNEMIDYEHGKNKNFWLENEVV